MEVKHLGERLKNREEEYITTVKREQELETVLEILMPLFTSTTRACYYFYPGSTTVSFYPSDIDNLEINIIPAISDAFGIKWRKIVEKEAISYHTSIDKEVSYFLGIYPVLTGTCTISAVATGRVKKADKWIQIDEPEFEFVVNCAE